jgi:hypothetical protein
MRRVFFAFSILILLVVVVSAQPPLVPAPPASPPAAPMIPVAPVAPPLVPPPAPGDFRPPAPPQPLPVVGAPAVAMPPPANTQSPLSKFEPLTSYPVVTQFSVRGVLLGSAWMAKMHQPHGRFLHGYNPTLRQPINGEHDLLQSQSALAMAQAAKFSGDKQQAVIARQAILTLLSATKISPTDPNCRVPMQVSFLCNRVGFAAILALAIYELPNAEDKLIEEAERLCAFIRSQLRNDGSVDYTDSPNNTAPQTDTAGMNEFPGFALHALAVSNRVWPAEWKKDAVKHGVAYYLTAFRAKPHPMMVATLTPAACELYLQTKLNEAATAALEMNDWLCSLQIGTTDPRNPQWAGGFRTVVNGQTTNDPPTAALTGLYVQSLACAYQLTRLTGDITREAKYLPALQSAVNFLCGLQFLEVNTRHFENTFRANMLIGAFYISPTDGNLRTDAAACATTGLLRFLSCGAESR